jgi:prolyl-tRNA synthetase
MKFSQLFIKTRKDAPADETAVNAQLLIRAGFIYKVMAGVYAYTPLGLIVIERIKQIVREEMNAIGGQELLMSSLQPQATWDITGRWDDETVDVWFKSRLKDGTEVGFGWSHEEAIVEMMQQYIVSYKDLPVSVYQFQNKLRNELRAKSGIMRGREFLMKDMYSMTIDADEHERVYQGAIEAYNKVYDRLGIGEDTYMTFASGGAFTQFSHEFQTICEAGEDTVYLNREKNVAVNEEVMDDENLKKLGLKRSELEAVKTAEVGNIFNFGTHKSEQMDFTFTNSEGERQFVHLGSYGIGISRVMGVIVEKYHDERGIIWPASVAPADYHLIVLGDDENVRKAADKLYADLMKDGKTVLYDDREERAGTKFADADLIGIPTWLTVSAKTLAEDSVEVKLRAEDESKLIALADIMKKES